MRVTVEMHNVVDDISIRFHTATSKNETAPLLSVDLWTNYVLNVLGFGNNGHKIEEKWFWTKVASLSRSLTRDGTVKLSKVPWKTRRVYL